MTIYRKYQKIKEIIARFESQYDHTTALDLMCEIRDIVKEGNENHKK